MKSYPIWNDITACNYQSSKSYGTRETGETSIYVGSSRANSNDFLKHITTKRNGIYNDKDCIIFSFSVDGVVIKKMIFEDNQGRAGEHIKTLTKLKQIKSL